MSGPVLGTRSLGDSVWGSAAGALLSWQAVDFGHRAGIDVARAQTSVAKSQTSLTELDAASAVDAFLTVLPRKSRFVRRVRMSIGWRSATTSARGQNQFRPAPINRAPRRNWPSPGIN